MNSKKMGNAFEVEMAFRLRAIFPDARTARFMGALWLDSQKVDLTGTGPFYFQCKATERPPSYHTILSQMPKNRKVNVILHKKNNSGVVAALNFEDFLNLIKKV